MRLLGRDLSWRNALPLVARELREESRRPINHLLRMLAAGVVITVFISFVGFSGVDVSRLGGVLFAAVFNALLLATWIIVPMMTADCISREKREGTLGLLFLTPLTVLDVMLGKAATHILRATTLLLASLPVLVLPFVMGGVGLGRRQALVGGLMLANALLLGIAAGLGASVKGGSAIQAMVMAEIYAATLFVASRFGEYLLGSLLLLLPWGPATVLWWLARDLGSALILFVLVIAASAGRLRRSWDQDAAAPEQPKWTKLFSGSAFWRGMFHWNRGGALDRNPMAWLQEYSWTARLTKWGWFLAMLVAEGFVIMAVPSWQPQVTLALSLGVAFSAAGCFRRERQSGLLEVLLVTPISARKIIAGRLWGIFSHFSPALLVLVLCWNAGRYLHPQWFARQPLAPLWPNPLRFRGPHDYGPLFVTLAAELFGGLDADVGAGVFAAGPGGGCASQNRRRSSRDDCHPHNLPSTCADCGRLDTPVPGHGAAAFLKRHRVLTRGFL